MTTYLIDDLEEETLDVANVIFASFSKQKSNKLYRKVSTENVVFDFVYYKTGEANDLLRARLNNQIVD